MQTFLKTESRGLMMIKVTGLALFLMTLFIPGQAYAEWHEASSDHFLVIADQNERGRYEQQFPARLSPLNLSFAHTKMKVH